MESQGRTAAQDRTAATVDGILHFAVTGSSIAAGLFLPGLMIGLEKPLNIFWKHMDKRERERELRRTISYMKTKNYLHGDYDHGLQITPKGRKRLEKIEFEIIKIDRPKTWDQKWRLVFFDIPESHRSARISLINKLKRLGFYQLQKSAWIHPFPCREVVERICSYYEIDRYVSYVEISYIDNQKRLEKKFKDILAATEINDR